MLKLQRERAKNLSVEDFGLKDDEDESDKELTLGVSLTMVLFVWQINSDVNSVLKVLVSQRGSMNRIFFKDIVRLWLFSQEISNQGKTAKKARLSKDAIDDLGTTFELNKDFNELSRKEQMEIISR